MHKLTYHSLSTQAQGTTLASMHVVKGSLKRHTIEQAAQMASMADSIAMSAEGKAPLLRGGGSSVHAHG